MKPRLLPVGDSALLVQLGQEIDPELNLRVHTLDARLREQPPEGVIETVPAYASILLHYDPLVLSFEQASEWVRSMMSEGGESATSKPRRIEVPVRYGGEAGPDLIHVAEHHGISTRDVVTIHTGRDYTVYMMGFTPGFPYMGKLEQTIFTPRLATPRTHVPVGSVGIAGEQTGIYPIESPGGWRLIGRTSLKIFDPYADPPFMFSPGDSVRFVIEALDA